MKTNQIDQTLIAQCDTSVRHRRKIELLIARRTITELLRAGYELTADNGEDTARGTADQLIENLFACDEAHLYARKGSVRSFVFFVLGNDGYDVICDHGVSLSPVMDAVQAYAEELEQRGE